MLLVSILIVAACAAGFVFWQRSREYARLANEHDLKAKIARSLEQDQQEYIASMRKIGEKVKSELRQAFDEFKRASELSIRRVLAHPDGSITVKDIQKVIEDAERELPLTIKHYEDEQARELADDLAAVQRYASEARYEEMLSHKYRKASRYPWMYIRIELSPNAVR